MILKVDVQGAATVRRMAPEALSIFLVPHTFAELEQRLTQRMTESDAERELRLRTAREELEQVQLFDYRVVNRDQCLDRAIQEIDAIITAEKCRVSPRLVQLL